MHLTKEEIIDYVMGDDVPQAAEHLARCGECHDEEESYRAVLKAVDDLPGPPEGFADKVWDAIRWRLEPRAPRRRFTPLRATAATLAILCLAALVVWLLRKPAGDPVAPQVKGTPPQQYILPAHGPVPPSQAIRNGPAAAPKPAQHGKGVITVSGREQAEEVRQAAGNVDRLAAIARNGQSAQVRIDAVHALGDLEDPEAAHRLVAMYGSEKEAEVRKAMIFALAVRQDTGGLETLAGREHDPELRANIQAALTGLRNDPNNHLVTHRPPQQ